MFWYLMGFICAIFLFGDPVFVQQPLVRNYAYSDFQGACVVVLDLSGLYVCVGSKYFVTWKYKIQFPSIH